MKKLRPKNLLIKDLDKVFSQFIRLRDGGICYTCKVAKPWKEMQCGHYEKRSLYPTRWNEQNCHCQCYRCNVAMGGNYPEYALHLQRDYGSRIFKKLNTLANSDKKWSREELETKIKYYKEKVNSMI